MGTADGRVLDYGEGTGVKEEWNARGPGVRPWKSHGVELDREREELQRTMEERVWQERSSRNRNWWRSMPRGGQTWL